MTKLKILILILSLIAINCKKSTEPELTLADRAGTYINSGSDKTYTKTITIQIFNTGKGTFQNGNASVMDITIGNPASTDTSFTFDVDADKGLIIDFKNMRLYTPEPSFNSTTFYLKKVS